MTVPCSSSGRSFTKLTTVRVVKTQTGTRFIAVHDATVRPGQDNTGNVSVEQRAIEISPYRHLVLNHTGLPLRNPYQTDSGYVGSCFRVRWQNSLAGQSAEFAWCDVQ